MVDENMIFKRRLTWALILLLGLGFILRLPSLFEPNRYADEDIYLTLGMAIRRGLVLYRDIHDNKPPAIYFIAALAHTILGFRFILLLWHSLNSVLVALLARWFFPKFPNAPLLIGLSFVLLTTLPLLEGNIANAEIFMILPVTAGLLLFWHAWESRRKIPIKIWLSIGVLLAAGFLFKVTAVFELAALSVFSVFLTAKNHHLWFIIAGFVTPILVTILYYLARGAGELYIRSVLLQNIGYLSSWTSGSNSNLFINSFIMLGSLAVLFLLRRQLKSNFLFITTWFLFSLFGVLLSSRPYPHYLIQAVLPGILLVGLSLTSIKTLPKLIGLAVAGLTLLAIIRTNFWYYRSLPYYQNFFTFALGQKTKAEYLAFFPGTGRNQKIAEYIRTHTLPDIPIFIWGTEPAIYVLSGHLPPGRFITSYHIRDFDPQGLNIQSVKDQRPPIIVTLDYEPDYRGFLTWLELNYVLAARIDNANIYYSFPSL